MIAPDPQHLWLQHLHDAELETGEQECLLDALAAGTQFREDCLADEHVDGMLHVVLSDESAGERFVDEFSRRLRGGAVPPPLARGRAVTRASVTRSVALPPNPSPEAVIASDCPAPPRRRKPRKRLSLRVVAAVCLALFGVVFSLAVIPWFDDDELPGTNGADPSRRAVAETPLRAEPIARLVDTHKCVWQGSEPQGLLAAGPLHLLSGRAAIRLDDGAVVEIRGPSRIQLESSGRLSVPRGQLSAVVPLSAVGFTVRTPTATIVDLGTRFDVVVDETGETQVAVTEGEVAVTPFAPNAEEFRLVAGESRSIPTASHEPPIGQPAATSGEARTAGTVGEGHSQQGAPVPDDGGSAGRTVVIASDQSQSAASNGLSDQLSRLGIGGAGEDPWSGATATPGSNDAGAKVAPSSSGPPETFPACGTQWHRSLPHALDEAKQKDQLVLYHASLGDLIGDT